LRRQKVWVFPEEEDKITATSNKGEKTSQIRFLKTGM
jgi:hypothetical protein